MPLGFLKFSTEFERTQDMEEGYPYFYRIFITFSVMIAMKCVHFQNCVEYLRIS